MKNNNDKTVAVMDNSRTAVADQQHVEVVTFLSMVTGYLRERERSGDRLAGVLANDADSIMLNLAKREKKHYQN